jgi:hypothetical protein
MMTKKVQKSEPRNISSIGENINSNYYKEKEA